MAFGRFWGGKSVPERRNSGMTGKFMINWKSCLSLSGEAITVALAGRRAGRAKSSYVACQAYFNVGLMRDKLKTAIVQAL